MVPKMLLHEEIVVRAAVAYSGEMIRIEELLLPTPATGELVVQVRLRTYAAPTWPRCSNRNYRRQRSWDMKSPERCCGWSRRQSIPCW